MANSKYDDAIMALKEVKAFNNKIKSTYERVSAGSQK